MSWKERMEAMCRRIWRSAKQYRLVLLVLLVGLVLLLLPSGSDQKREAVQAAEPQETFRLEEAEQKLAQALSKIDGAGEVTVLLTVRTGTQQVLAQDVDSGDGSRKTQTVVLSRGGSQEDTVTVQEIYPQYQGALLVCSGGGNAKVRLELTQAMTALTGLGADKISISKGK